MITSCWWLKSAKFQHRFFSQIWVYASNCLLDIIHHIRQINLTYSRHNFLWKIFSFCSYFWKKDTYQQYKAPFSKLSFYSLDYRHQEDEDSVSWSVCVLIATTWAIQLEMAKVGAHYMFIKWWMNHLIEDEKI